MSQMYGEQIPGAKLRRKMKSLSRTKVMWKGKTNERYVEKAASLEDGWNNRSCVWEAYIPDFTGSSTDGRIGQIEDFIKRPSTPDVTYLTPPEHWDRVKKQSPMLFVNSMSWNRRHYEPEVPFVTASQGALQGPSMMPTRFNFSKSSPVGCALC
jgi:hypothetical protein